MLKLEIQQKGEEARVEEFEPGEIQIGRVNGNDIVLPKGNISKRHAKIVYANGSATLSDTNSTNGTFLNGERITSNPLSAADKIYLGEFVITVLGLDEESGDSVEISLDEATATSTHIGEDVLEESSWGGQDGQKEEWNANWEAADGGEDDDEFDPLAAATDYSDLEPANDEAPPEVIVPAAPNIVTRDFDPVETGAIEFDESLLVDEIEVDESEIDNAEEQEALPAEAASEEVEAPADAPSEDTGRLVAQHFYADGTGMNEHSDGSTTPTTTALQDAAESLGISTDIESSLVVGESHATWLSDKVIERGCLIVQPASAFATSLAALGTQGIANESEAKLLGQLVEAKLSVAVIGNHGPLRRSLLSAIGHHAASTGSLSVLGLAGPVPSGAHVLNTTVSDDALHLALRTLSSDATLLGSGLAEHQWEGTVALGLAGTLTEAPLGQSSHLETLYGALSMFDAVVVTGRRADGTLGIISVESVESSASGASTVAIYKAADGTVDTSDTSLAGKISTKS